jgi:predicted GNAT superfamily acetyltransferase
MHYENLLTAYSHISVKEMNLSFGFKGLYMNGKIRIDSKLTTIEKGCVLAEELGHHYMTVGNILDQSKVENRKQEKVARSWAYKELIPLSCFIDAHRFGCTNRYEVADYLGVTEAFLQETLDRYIEKHGNFIEHEDLVLHLNPLNIFSKKKGGEKSK